MFKLNGRGDLAAILDDLVGQVESLSDEITDLTEGWDFSAVDDLTAERDELKAEIEELKLEKGRIKEAHAREKRDIEHATGLHLKQTAWERKKAGEEAALKVREENLDAEKKRYAEQLKSHKDQIKGEVDRMERLIQGLMERLPVVKVDGRAK